MHKLVFESHFAYYGVTQLSANALSFGRTETLRIHAKNKISYQKCSVGRWRQSSLSSTSNWLLSYCEYDTDTYD